MNDTECLRLIRRLYGGMVVESAHAHGVRAEVLAGIMMRETRGGTSALLDVQGARGRGDGGHGHGLMQIDDRSFPTFCASDEWYDPGRNVDMGAWVLHHKRRFLYNQHLRMTEEELERASIAAYNAGEGTVLRSVLRGEDVDAHTTGGDYSVEVLRYAGMYMEVCDEQF